MKFQFFYDEGLQVRVSYDNIFKSSSSYGWLAQLAEQRTLNPWVQGSIP